MLLKKVANKTGPEPAEGQAWPLDHVKVLRAGKHQRFSPRFVQGALSEGWLSMDGRSKTITLHTVPELVYQIVAVPGRYCSHCGAKLQDDPDGVQARAHVAAEHAGETSPDPANPAGYRCDNFYDCRLKNRKAGES